MVCLFPSDFFASQTIYSHLVVPKTNLNRSHSGEILLSYFMIYNDAITITCKLFQFFFVTNILSIYCYKYLLCCYKYI
jgi:lipid-A-disaccharide synthase-like uncharacterized protein